MKARIVNKDTDKILMTRAGIKEVVEEEFIKKEYELYEHCVQDITAQVLSNVINTLEYWYGWRKDRIRKFINYLHSEEDDMVNMGISTLDNIERIKKRYDIDLMTEFPARIEKSGVNIID